jgi:hypothetical protein
MSIKSFDDANDFFPSAEPASTGLLASLRAIWLAFTDRFGTRPERGQHAISEVYPGR